MSWNPLRKFGTLGRDGSSQSTQSFAGIGSSNVCPSATANLLSPTSPTSTQSKPLPPLPSLHTTLSSNSSQQPPQPPQPPVTNAHSTCSVEQAAEQETAVGQICAQLPSLCEKLHILEKRCKAISRTGKRLVDSTISLARFQCKLSEELASSALVQQHSTSLRSLLQDWHTFNLRCSRLAEDRASTVPRTMLDPLKQLSLVFAHLRECARKQQRMHMELLKARSKLESTRDRERTAANLVRSSQAQCAYERARADFVACAEGLLSEMRSIATTRITYAQPSLEALVKAETLFWAEALRGFTSDQPVLHSSNANNRSSFRSRSEISDEEESLFAVTRVQWNEHSIKQRERLDAISKLSIVEGAT